MGGQTYKTSLSQRAVSEQVASGEFCQGSSVGAATRAGPAGGAGIVLAISSLLRAAADLAGAGQRASDF